MSCSGSVSSVAAAVLIRGQVRVDAVQRQDRLELGQADRAVVHLLAGHHGEAGLVVQPQVRDLVLYVIQAAAAGVAVALGEVDVDGGRLLRVRAGQALQRGQPAGVDGEADGVLLGAVVDEEVLAAAFGQAHRVEGYPRHRLRGELAVIGRRGPLLRHLHAVGAGQAAERQGQPLGRGVVVDDGDVVLLGELEERVRVVGVVRRVAEAAAEVVVQRGAGGDVADVGGELPVGLLHAPRPERLEHAEQGRPGAAAGTWLNAL